MSRIMYCPTTRTMPTLLVIAGPTASGKTALAVRLAQRLGTEIISADSRQCFRELNIGVARPKAAEMQGIPHHFIASHSIEEEVNAGVYEAYALAAAERIFAKNDIAVVVGGTGLYIKALCEGMDAMPAIPKAIRERLNADFAQQGLEWLQKEVRTQDPAFWEVAEQQNPKRLLRALEMITATGQSITAFRTQHKAGRPFDVLKFAIDMPRTVLYERINRRVDMMMAGGLEQEARSVFAHRDINALQTVGYKELFDFFDGKITLGEAVENIKKNSRHYAKRQVTWFRKDPAFEWIHNDAVEGILEKVK